VFEALQTEDCIVLVFLFVKFKSSIYSSKDVSRTSVLAVWGFGQMMQKKNCCPGISYNPQPAEYFCDLFSAIFISGMKTNERVENYEGVIASSNLD
jgi:hypothetical protein